MEPAFLVAPGVNQTFETSLNCSQVQAEFMNSPWTCVPPCWWVTACQAAPEPLDAQVAIVCIHPR